MQFIKKLSIIIPTKNRYTCLVECVNNIVPYLTDDTEIIIQDNSDCNTEFNLDLLTDKTNVRYFYQPESIPISNNTELAIENSVGRYLLFIGDDDFISPYIEKIISFVEKNNIQCLTYNAGYYWWDTVEFAKRYKDRDNKVLTLSKHQSINLRQIDAKDALQKVLKRGAIDYSGLPRFYHGIVNRETLEIIKDRTGQYLNGSCPDMAFSVSLCLVLESFHYIDYPVTLFGASKNSGGGMTAQNTHFKKLEDATFLRLETINNWGKCIPRVWSEKTIYPQTTLEILNAFNDKIDINLYPFYASIIVYEPQLKPYLYTIINHKFSFIQHLYLYCHVIRKWIGFFYKRFFKSSSSKNIVIYRNIEVKDISKLLLSRKFEF